MKFRLNKLVSPKLINANYLSFFLVLGFLSPLPGQDNQALAQQANDLSPTAEFPLSASFTDTSFYLSEELPEPSESEPKQQKRDRSGWAITPIAGTMGLGGHLSISLIRDTLNLRGGFTAVAFGGDFTERDTTAGVTRQLTYDTDLRLSGGIPLLVDWFPWKNMFRVTGGLVINRNKLEFRAQPRGNTVEIGDIIFDVSDVGQLDGNVEYNGVAPYLGIGIGNPVGRSKKFTFFAELGAFFQGSATVDLEANGRLANSPILKEALEREIGDIDDEITFDDLPIYPVLQIGFSYQF